MRRYKLTTGLTAGVWLLAALTTGCMWSDEPASTTSPDRAAPDSQTLAAVSLPDLSPLKASIQDRVRQRYSSLRLLVNTGAPPAELADAHGALGLILMATNYPDAAATCYLHAQALMPEDMRWPYYLGQLHTYTGNVVRAAEFFERAVELQPTDVAALVSLGQARLVQGRPEAAEPLFGQAALLDPSSAAALAGLGRAALASGDHARATEYLQRALDSDRKATSLHVPLAMAYRALERLDQADAHLQQRGDGVPTLHDPLMEEFRQGLLSAETFVRRGVDALNTGRPSKAAEIFRTAIAVEPDNPELRQWLATTLFTVGDIPGAVEQLEETLRRSPEFPNAHFGLGSILFSNGQYLEAAERFTAAVTYDPAYLEARIGLADALRAAGRLEESLPHYEQVVATAPRFTEAWTGGAEALVSLEHYEEARGWLAEARNLYPNRQELVRLAETVAAATAARR